MVECLQKISRFGTKKGNNMKYLALIQARCGSTRLPNKVLSDLAGKTDIERVIYRVKQSKYVDEVMVITSIEYNNLPLIKICAETNTRIFVGSENDVLDRYYQAAKLLQPEYVIRITADCPLFDWRYLDSAIEQMKPDSDYLWEASETFPDGLDIEIIKYSALKNAWKHAILKSEREHVTLYIKNNPNKFVIEDFVCPIKGIGDKRWTLDEDADYVMINEIYNYFEKINKHNFVTEDILEYLRRHPEVEIINKGIERNEGLKKSLENDGTATII